MLKNVLKLLLPSQAVIFAKKIQHLLKIAITRIMVKNLIRRNTNELKLEIGSGSKTGSNGWKTLDMTPGCDIYWDLNMGLPFPDESVTEVYSSHVFEHFSFQDGQRLLKECKRVLIPGGCFSICVPNAKIFIQAYVNGEVLGKEKYFGHKPAYNNTGRLDYINYIAYMDGHHKYMFDEDNLVAYLQQCCFKDVRLRKFNQDIDLKVRDIESIYAEAIK